MVYNWAIHFSSYLIYNTIYFRLFIGSNNATMPKRVSFTQEYTFRASPTILFNLLSTPSGLTLWFADSADINDGVCSFIWDGNEDIAYVLDQAENEFIRYRWDYQDEEEFFEFRISKSEVTGDTILQVTDFADDYELDDQKLLWDQQIKELSTQVGG